MNRQNLQLITANDSHSHLLQTFFSEQTLNGHVDYGIYRPNSFFDHYKLFTDDYSTAMLVDDEQNVQGVANMSFRRAYVNRQEQTIAYLSDLRIAPQRVAIQKWAEHFVPYFYKQLEERNCNYVFSTIEQYENRAYNALLRPQKNKRLLPRYYLFRQFHLNFYLGRWPWAQKPISSIKIHHATENDIEEICEYLLRKKVGSRLYFNVTPETLKQRFQQWPNFSAHHFLLARDNKLNLIGCVAPWNNKDVQQILIKKYNAQGEILRQSLKVGSPFRVTTRLPKQEQTGSMLALTHCAFDNPAVFYALIYQAYNEKQPEEVLAHINYMGDYITRPPKSFITTKIPYGFYTVRRENEELPSSLYPNPFTPPPDFDAVQL